MDSVESWQNQHFIKLGLGNYSTPFADMGFSFGDGSNSSITIHANHVSSKGSLDFQEFGKTGIDVLSIFKTQTQKSGRLRQFIVHQHNIFMA